MIEQIRHYLGDEADDLLHHECKTIPKEQLVLPSPHFVDDVVAQSDRNNQVLKKFTVDV